MVVEVIDAPWAGVPVRIRWFKGSSELSVGDRGLRVEVEVLDDERTSTPAVFKGPRQCLTLPAAAVRRLIVVIGVICSSVWRASI